MDFKTWKETMRKSGQTVPKPMELLAGLDEAQFVSHIAAKTAAYSGSALPAKVKSLVAVAVGIALDSPDCIMNNVQAAKAAGATKQEIMETFTVAKFSKGATVHSASMNALEWLSKQS